MKMEIYVQTLLQFLLFTLFCEDGCAQVFNLRLSIEEGLPAKTIVGDIRAGLPAKSQSSGFFISESIDSDVFRDFEIDGDTGIISTAVVLDRERTDKYEFAAATLTGEVIKVIIEVKDVNDHSPAFPVKTIQLNVSELSPPGTCFELEGAQDQDEGDYGIQGYRITDGDMRKLFKVEIRNSGGGMFSFDLILQARLDREITSFYSFTIDAFDGGLPPKTGQLQVHITVLDENDNQPVFNQTEYLAVVLENTPLMTPVCQVFATDPDLGSNGWVTYKINRRQSDPNEFFVIDSSSGIISVNTFLDYENQSFFELVVTAWDSGIQPESSSTFVSIKVLDVNDNHPNISILFLNEPGAPEVSEGARPGDYVARIAVSDPDLGDVKKIDVHLQGGDGMFSLKSTDDFLYVLCVDGPLDREVKDVYELIVTARDFGSPPLSSKTTFQVQVTDVNDNPPVFDQNIYEESIPEDVREGTALFRVKTTDRDLGGDSGIIYSIMQPEQEQLLNIDATSGLITTAAGLDHERETELKFLVVAIDGGSPSLSSTATVTIHVVDVNDNKPIFKQQFYNVTVKEHTAVGTCILQVTATDADDAEFGSVQYSLYDGFSSKDDHPYFHINSVTGEICVSQDIDHEAGLVTFDLSIKAEDQDGLSSQTFVHINVEDVNDNAPVFSPEKYVTSVSIHAQPGTELLSIFASDRDSGNNGKITYELLPGDSASLFTVDQSTGSLFLNASLSQLRSSSVKLSVSAQDGGGMSAVYPANITVNILQSDQPPALFQKAHYTFSISEDAPVGSSVGLVQAVTPANSVELLSYIISSGDPQRLFSIDSQSGIITTGQPLDHESLSYAILNIQFHTGTLPIYSSAQVNISITDVNDNPPVFQKTSEHITISHNTPPGMPIFIAHAHDADSDLNGRIHYMLRPESHLFSIHPRIGTLMLNGDVSGDSSQRYELNVIAEDEGHPSLSSMLRLVIEMDSLGSVEDTLAFETLVYQVEIGESAPKDTRMIQVRAHGTRSQHGGTPGKAPPIITYSLKTLSGVPPFRIHPETGWMFVSQSLDYETEPVYRFSVCAKAQNGKTAATATVVVTVQDENDNAPVFSRDVYFFSLQEGPSPHGMIGTVKATDRDSRNNGVLSYILLSEGKYFRINPRTGEIINTVALDREEQAQHVLRVMATDQGRPRLNTTTTVHILVTDINDNPPQFTHLPATKELNVQVWAGIPVNSVIITMFAKDLDAGENGTVKFTMKDNRLGHFSIDNRNGDVRVTSRFSSNPQKRYSLRVVATDDGLFPLEENAVVHIQVYALDQQNGNSKDFQSLEYFTVREDVKLGTVIGSLGISNAPNMQLRYFIVEGDGSLQFGIKSSSGELYVAQHLDYEVTQRYFLVVRAEAPPTFNVTAFVVISVVDVNDHTPWFPGNGNFVVFGVYEDVTNGTVVYVFNAHDGDGSLRNSELYYSLTYDPDPAVEGLPLHIDPHTGVVQTNGRLDREHTENIVFRVTVSDNAEEPTDRKHTSVIAQAILLDINDNSPTFVSTEMACVPEDTEVGLLVHHVMAKDEDEGSNGHVIYSVISGNEMGYFHMESTGHLYLNSSLDYESQNVHILTIQARDSGICSLSSTQTLTVKILDVNDNPPVFQQHIYNTTIMENREPGEIIITVTAVDLDSEANSAVSYSLLPGPGYELFTINSHTGQISTSTRLDREIQSSFTLRVQAEDSGTPSLSSTATVLCSVLDDNDNTPEFSQLDLHIVIPENLPPGVIHILQASDIDNGLNGTIQYFIEEDKECFSIDTVTGAISTTRILDREERSNYSLVITAADHGHPPLSSTVLLHITLSDENDNSPSFTRKSYRSSISEGLPAGSEILHLIAWDPDEGPNGVVTFSLEEENSGHFYVDGSTGVIRLTKPLDRETRSQHVFRAVATDGCSQGPRSSVATVTIQVEDINDNSPACINKPMQVSVSSITTRPSRPIITVSAQDPDHGDNGTIVFSLADEDEMFQVDESGAVRLKAPLSNEVYGTKLLRIRAADLGRPSLTSSCLVLIQLNGEEPLLQFTEELYEVTMPENSKTGSWVANVVAHDLTADEGTIKYTIFSGNENEAFTINPITGDITVREQRLMDFEVQHKIHLVVLAEKGHQTAYARVAITLQDVNDNAPVFKQSYYRTAVWEGQIHNTYVMQVLATDSDSGVNGQISYFIVDGNHNNAFVIDSVRGILATNAVLDREIVSSYKLILQAEDMGSPPLTGTCTVRVQVVDVNDNSPTIPSMEPVTIAENLPVGYIVTQVTANDVDLSPSATYRFIEMDQTSRCFAVDQYSGVITTTKSLNYEDQAVHTLRVEASDSVHQTEAEISIKVLDVNDNPPVFSQESYQVVLPERTSADSYVVSVSATDKDSGQNGRISYRLLSSPARGFYIDPDNGSVFTNKPLSYVANGNMLRLLVEARDSGDPNLFSVTSVDIEVVDFNDNAPFFTQNSYEVSVPEDVSVGSTLLTLFAEDKDYSNKNTHLEYAIVGGNDERRFCLEVVSIPGEAQSRTVGQIVLCDTLNREATDTYLLTVTVTDRGTPPLNSSTVISVKVLDINDNAPVFSSLEYHAQVTENSPLGTALIYVSAYDPDLGANGTVTYNIISGNNRGLIRVDSATGILEVNGALDYEEDSKFTLTVQASDGNPSDKKISFAIVYILVLDENDHSPFFMFPTHNCSVPENLPAFTHVCTVHAVDEDAGTFGLLTYSILTPCFVDYDSTNPEKKEAFGIDPLTGDIHTKQTFDFEGESEFCFVVEARDKGDQVATLRVRIEIEGIDEFSPIFTHNVYHFSLPTNVRVGQSIGQLMAMDHDGGLDGLVEYSLINPSPFFSVNKTTGYLYISNSVYQKRSPISNETIEDLTVLASSPKLDSKTSICHVVVNISSSAKPLTSVDLSVHTASLTVSLIVFLLLLISFIYIVLRCRFKEKSVKKATSLSANLNHESDSLGTTGENLHSSISGINLQDLQEPLDMRGKMDIPNPSRNSNSKTSSGRGSTEEETTEDQEIKMINKFACFKQLSSVTAQLSDSGIPGDSDQLSFHSVDEDPSSSANIGMVQIVDMPSSESLHNFKDEGGGEGMLPQVVNMKEVEEVMRRCMSMSDDQGSVEGSLTNLISSEEQLHGSYSWDYFLNWQPRFQSLASVFTDIGMLPDEGMRARDVEPESQSLLRPPPLITAFAQPGIRAVPPRMPYRRSPLVRLPTYTKTHTRNTELTHSAMTPSFSPSLSVLTVRTPSTSPVVSETGLGSYTKISTLPRDILDEAEIQV
ncbi:protocadherin-23 [Sinocyclocheilus grahami]|uniref:protocadherin-23 n=1 Tax=Sinocyclocheilus grahami TaxID=75366 RepID=UPI0007AD327F|nr:PREDICTED: protocadherin-23 [Sinocyclocheilus grahami]